MVLRTKIGGQGRVTDPDTDGRLLRKGNKVAIAKRLRNEGKLLREIAFELECSVANAYYLANMPETSVTPS